MKKTSNNKKLKAELDKLFLNPKDDNINKFEEKIIEKTNEFLDEKFKNGEIKSAEVTPTYNKENESLTININMQMHKPVEKVEVTMEKPEGMSDKQFEIFIKNLQKEIEEYDIHEGELTS